MYIHHSKYNNEFYRMLWMQRGLIVDKVIRYFIDRSEIYLFHLSTSKKLINGKVIGVRALTTKENTTVIDQ